MEQARRVLSLLREKGLSPDVEVFTTIAKGYFRANRPAECEAVLEEIREAGLRPNVVTYTTVNFDLV